MNNMQFVPARRKASFFRLGLIGASGSGKTLSSLLFARGLVGPKGRIAVVDTENGSASLYDDKIAGGFDVLEMGPPWSVARYLEALNAAAKAAYDAVILDQVSYMWEADGGILELVDKLAKGKKDGFSAWREATPIYQDFLRAIVAAPLHVIVCIQAKPAYEVMKSGDKVKITKIGTKPIQRDGIETQFTTSFFLDSGNCAECDKDRTGLFKSRPSLPLTIEDGKAAAKWLNSGERIEATADLVGTGTSKKSSPSPEFNEGRPEGPYATIENRKAIVEAGKLVGLTAEETLGAASEVVGMEISGTRDIPAAMVGKVLKALVDAGRAKGGHDATAV